MNNVLELLLRSVMALIMALAALISALIASPFLLFFGFIKVIRTFIKKMR
jgi:hypothetical protein